VDGDLGDLPYITSVNSPDNVGPEWRSFFKVEEFD